MFRIIAAVSLLASTSAFALDSLDELEDVVCCVHPYNCAPINQYQWRPVKEGIELMVFRGEWCRVELLNFPIKRIFNGEPADMCKSLICFSPPKR